MIVKRKMVYAAISDDLELVENLDAEIGLVRHGTFGLSRAVVEFTRPIERDKVTLNIQRRRPAMYLITDGKGYSGKHILPETNWRHIICDSIGIYLSNIDPTFNWTAFHVPDSEKNNVIPLLDLGV